MTSRDLDVVIAGAGASGLSLAVRLAARQPQLSVLVLEPRASAANDRTFCFFRGRPHPFERAIAHRWPEIEVRDASRTVRRAIAERPYEELPGGAFQELAAELVAQSERVELERGVTVSSFSEGAERVEVVTSRGTLRTRLFVDARGGRVGARAEAGDVRWSQHFVGQVVRTERPIFTPTRATLMDFEVPQREGPHFVYVLPRSPHEALVEDTYFSATPLPRERYEDAIRDWLVRHDAGAFEILRSEHGVIPMTTAPQARSARSRVAVIGQRGGAAKPSTGYAFQFIQRQCDALVDAIATEGLAAPLSWVPPRSHVAMFYDRVFLSYLRKNDTLAPRLFVGLFERVPPAALVRFLSEEGTVLDHLRVMNAVPRLGVMTEAARSRGLWLRSR